MLLSNLFLNTLETLTLEFFLTVLILTLLLFGTFLTKLKKKVSPILIINKIIIYFLIFSLYFLYNSFSESTTLFNGLFSFNNLFQFVKTILIINSIIFFIIQDNYLKLFKLIKFENSILLLISLVGLIFFLTANNFIILYLAIELQSLSFYILTASNTKSIFGSESAIKYFILGAIASVFILFGSSLIYCALGTLNFSHIFCLLININQISNLLILSILFLGLFFILIGLFFKIGVAPFHSWLPDVYEGSPSNITAFFVIIPKIAIITFLIKFMFIIFYDYLEFFKSLFYLGSVFSLIIGSFATLYQYKIKRLFAYSSIGHVGFILMGFLSNSLYSVQNILLYIIIYIIMNINIWTVILSIYKNNKPLKYLNELNNFSKVNLPLSIIILINLFSMAGIPPLAGFFSKMFVLLTAIESSNIGLSILAIFISAVSSFYYIRLIKIMFFDNSLKLGFFTSLNKTQSLILAINSQIIIFFFLFSDYFLFFLYKITLFFIV